MFIILQRIIKRALSVILKAFSTAQLEKLIKAIIAQRTDMLLPDEALRFLLHLDNYLYTLEGKKAVEYGGGIHIKHRHIRYHDFFVNRINKGERVLDIGCGNGALTRDIAERAGAYVIGIDLNPDNIVKAEQHHAHPKVEYRVGDALKDLPQDSFDVVVLSNVLEHLPNRVEFLRKIQTILSPSRILIRVPLYERDWRVPLKEELGIDYRLDPTHRIEYTVEGFAEEVEEAGLKIAYQEVRWGELWTEVVRDAET